MRASIVVLLVAIALLVSVQFGECQSPPCSVADCVTCDAADPKKCVTCRAGFTVDPTVFTCNKISTSVKLFSQFPFLGVGHLYNIFSFFFSQFALTPFARAARQMPTLAPSAWILIMFMTENAFVCADFSPVMALFLFSICQLPY
jgi:hypothetical protein